MFKLQSAYFGAAKGNLLSFLGILDSTIVNTKAKAMISPIRWSTNDVFIDFVSSLNV